MQSVDLWEHEPVERLLGQDTGGRVAGAGHQVGGQGGGTLGAGGEEVINYNTSAPPPRQEYKLFMGVFRDRTWEELRRIGTARGSWSDHFPLSLVRSKQTFP